MEKYDYIVIGSGFGGSVSALRLTEKAYSVAVLEQGRDFKDHEFPKTNWDIKNFLWAPLIKCFGIQKITWFKNVLVLSGTGVGGGSLVYANTHMTPPDSFFNNKVWSHLKDPKAELMPFYTLAKRMLGTTKNPWVHKADEVLKDVAMEFGTSAKNVEVGVYFGEDNKDPYFNGYGPKRNSCLSCAGCMVGCRHNAKNTLVKNYLYLARKFGAKVFSKTYVDKIEFKNDEYFISTYKTGSWFKTNKKTYVAKGLVVSGGVLGTVPLLLKQKYFYNTLPKLSYSLGDNIRTNSEMLCGVTTSFEKLNDGVAISSVMNPDKQTHVEIVKYPSGSSFMKLLTFPYISYFKFPTRFILGLLQIIKKPMKYLKLYLKKGWADRTIIFLVMQDLDSSFKMQLKKWPWKYFSLHQNEGDKVPAYIPSGTKVMESFAKKIDGITQSSLIEIMADRPATAHILGGCPMGESGVVDSKFKVLHYPNMYILDASIIPCNLGVNPSLTITALSEYAMSFIGNHPTNKRSKSLYLD